MKDMKTMKKEERNFMSFMVNFSLALAWKQSGLGSEAALEAKRPWKRSGLVQVMD
jgi:hypothetical protein